MGFEFTLALSAAQLDSDAGDFQGFISYFDQAVAVGVYPVETGPAHKKYAFALPLRSKWPEDLLIQLDSAGWYLCFHVATSHQLTAIMRALTQCLAAVGVAGRFEEV